MKYNAEQELINREERDAPKKYKRFKFSGKSWQYLEDIWPRDVRMSSDAYKIMALIIFPIRRAQKFAKMEGQSLRIEDIILLFWIQRIEDAKENFAANEWAIGNPLDWAVPLTRIKRRRLVSTGLIEFYPGSNLIRITAQGKILMSKIIEDLEQANRDVVEYTRTYHNPTVTLYDKVIARFNEVWEMMDL